MKRQNQKNYYLNKKTAEVGMKAHNYIRFLLKKIKPIHFELFMKYQKSEN